MPRLAVLAVAALALIAGLAYVTRDLWRPGPTLAFIERADAPGFRDLTAEPRPGAPGAPDTAGLCRALFDDPDAPRIGSGPTLAVYFTDYRCPYCRVLGAMLLERAEAGEITLVMREWPILGPASQAAARAALAAARQGAYLQAYAALVDSAFVPTPAYVRDLATRLGLDPDQVAAEFGDPAMEAHLARNADLAARLGIAGTPGLVVGRTVVHRAVDDRVLDALIDAETGSGPLPC